MVRPSARPRHVGSTRRGAMECVGVKAFLLAFSSDGLDRTANSGCFNPLIEKTSVFESSEK